MNGFIESMLGSMFGTAFIAMLGTLIVLWIILAIAIYIYVALVLMTTANKLKHKDISWLAWIPIANFFLLPIMAKKHWALGFLILVPIVNLIFAVIWIWSIFEQRKYPGWLSLIHVLSFIPAIGGIASIGSLIIWGLVAWVDR